MGNDNRLNYIDFLKFLGLTGIILAHVKSPDAVILLRSFDVPLMVLLSAFLSYRSWNKFKASNLSTTQYYLSRFKRLVFPVWIFLTVYFCIYAVLNRHLFDFSYYIYSYGLTRYGIGYVWIILIYLYCALLVPLFDRIEYSRKSLLAVGLVYVLYEIAFYYKIGTTSKLLMSTIYYIIPYGTIAFIGFYYEKMSQTTRRIIWGFSAVVFIICACFYWTVNGSFQLVNIVKFPPRLYYLSYGILWSFLLLFLCRTKNYKWFWNKVFRFVAAHSMWIYLWHILWLTVYDVLHLPSIWIIKLLVVYVGASLTVIIVNRILNLIERKWNQKIIKYLRG